jgi:hypothetical protein
VLVMSQGKVAEYDTPTNLLANEVSAIWVELSQSKKWMLMDCVVVHLQVAGPGGGSGRVMRLKIHMQKSVSDPQQRRTVRKLPHSANEESRLCWAVRRSSRAANSDVQLEMPPDEHVCSYDRTEGGTQRSTVIFV